MWSNLNDSFSALTGSINANISNLRQSIPVSFGDQENEEDKVQQLEIKIKLIQEEVFRHRDIALLYKDRWLTAQEALKSNGIQSKDYHDEIDLLGTERPKSSPAPESSPTKATTSTASTDLTALSEISLVDDEESFTAPARDYSGRPAVAAPSSISDLALDSAAKEIQRLAGELAKVNADRDHWKTLAKQKSNAEEELDEARFQIVNYTTELKKCQLALEEALSAKSELEVELQELDAQHETALATVIKMRDEALEKLQTAEMVLESSSQHDRGSSDGVTVQQRDSATIIDASTTSTSNNNTSAVNDNAEGCGSGGAGGHKDEQLSAAAAADAIDAVASVDSLHSRLRSLADDLNGEQPLSAVVDQIAARISNQKNLEMRLELLTGSNQELLAKISSVQEEAERKLKRQDELLEEVELMNEQLTEELEALKMGAGKQKASLAASARPKSAEPSVESTEELFRKKQEIATLTSSAQEYQHQVEQLTDQLKHLQAQVIEQAQVLASKEALITEHQKVLSSLEKERDRLLEQSQASEAEFTKAVEGKEATIAKLSENLAELETQIRKIQLEREQQKKEFDFAVEQLKTRETELLQTNEGKDLKIEELEHKLEDVQSAAQSEAASLPEHREEPEGAEPESIEANLKVVNKEVQAELECLIAERDSLRQSLTALEEELSQMKTANGKLEEQAKKVLEEQSSLMKRLEELQQCQSDLDRLQPLHQQLVEQFEVLSAEHRQTVEELAVLKMEVASQASTSEKDTEELAQLREAVKRMSVLVQDKDQEVRELREKTAHLEAAGAMAELREGETERLKTELERLRAHLVAVEDNYTAELMAAEQRLEEAGGQVARLQADAEGGAQLAEQLKTMRTARDKARNELSALEDKVQSYSTSIANLQAVIGQLERDHQRKVRSLEAEHQERLEGERAQTAAVVRKLQAQEERLRETLEALEAASRLSETIDAKEFAISQLKREVSLKCTEITALQKKIDDLKTSYEGKIDKQIVKSLLISFFATTHGTPARTEAERLLARFLDFNQQEMERAGIKIGRSAAKSANDSFTSMFVEFLESESKKEGQGLGARKDSVSAPSGTAELAKDLNKRLAQTAGTTGAGTSRPPITINPFVSHPSGPPALGHHRTPSSASTGSSTGSLEHGAGHNALFTGAAGTAASGAANIAQIVRDVVEKKDEDQFI